MLNGSSVSISINNRGDAFTCGETADLSPRVLKLKKLWLITSALMWELDPVRRKAIKVNIVSIMQLRTHLLEDISILGPPGGRGVCGRKHKTMFTQLYVNFHYKVFYVKWSHRLFWPFNLRPHYGNVRNINSCDCGTPDAVNTLDVKALCIHFLILY